MAIPQGSVVVNTAYFTSMANRAAGAKSCAELQAMNLDISASIGATVAAINQQISTVQTRVTQVADQIAKLGVHIGTLAATQASTTAIGTVGATAAGVSDLSSAIAYIKAQGATLVSYGTTGTATLVEQARALNADYQALTSAYNLIVKQLTSLTSQITGIATALTGLQNAIANAALQFPGCTI